MRSVFIHYSDSEQLLVRAWLDERATPGFQQYQWIWPDSERAILWCEDFPDRSDWEPDDVARLDIVVPAPSSSLFIRLSGTVPGRQELLRLAIGLLEAVPSSVAEDDYTDHLWTLDELRRGASVEGHPFFDYLGWHGGETA